MCVSIELTSALVVFSVGDDDDDDDDDDDGVMNVNLCGVVSCCLGEVNAGACESGSQAMLHLYIQ